MINPYSVITKRLQRYYIMYAKNALNDVLTDKQLFSVGLSANPKLQHPFIIKRVANVVPVAIIKAQAKLSKDI